MVQGRAYLQWQANRKGYG